MSFAHRHVVAWFPLFLLACGAPAPAPEDGGAPDAGAPDAGPGTCLDVEDGPVEATFVIPRDGTDSFFDLPWPHDLRRQPDGHLAMTGFPTRGNPYIQRYLDAIDATLEGFANNGAVYFTFSREVSATSLPGNPLGTLEDNATVFILDVDPDSPERGTRHPAVVHYQECPTRFWPAHTVAVRPVYGAPLASGRRYAVVITRDVVPARGEPRFARDDDFEALLGTGGDDAVSAARVVYGDAFDVIEAAGVDRDELLSVSVFTTQDATSETIGIRDWMVDNYPAPTVDPASVTVSTVTPLFEQLTGTYGPVPVFQAGEIPYEETGGRIEVDPSTGAPTVHAEYRATFTVTVPTADMPATGYPVVLYAHGTGGDHASFVRNDTALHLARRGFAVIGIDQIHHGDRNPTRADPSVLFFNIPNPQAARDNNRQSALDVVQQARLVSGFTLPMALASRGGAPVRLDPDRILFMGHSQGGLNGPIYLAIDDSAIGGVLSAASAVITPSLIEKVEPISIPVLVKALLMLPGSGVTTRFGRRASAWSTRSPPSCRCGWRRRMAATTPT